MFKNGWRSAGLQLGISQGTAYSLEHDILGFHKVSTRWVPSHLIEEHKHNRHSICAILVERYNHEGDNLLNHIITRDETRIHHYEPETQQHSMQWKRTSCPSCKKFKSQPSARKLLLTVCWDCQWQHGNKCKLLRHVRKGTEIGYPHKPERKVVIGCFVTPHCMPSYSTPQHQHHSKTELASSRAPCLSPDLTPSNFHLYGCLKNAVRGRRFVEDDEMKAAVHDCYVINQKTFFPVASRSLHTTGLSVSRKRRLH